MCLGMRVAIKGAAGPGRGAAHSQGWAAPRPACARWQERVSPSEAGAAEGARQSGRVVGGMGAAECVSVVF